MNPTHPTPSGPITVDTEAAFVGCLMRCDAEAARELLAGMRADDLASPIASEVLALAIGLVPRGIAPDPAVLYAEARRTGRLDTEHRHELLTDWLIDTYRAAAEPIVGSYLKTSVLEAAYRRALREYAYRILTRVDHVEASQLADLAALDDRAIDLQQRHHRATEGETTRPITPATQNESRTGDFSAVSESRSSSPHRPGARGGNTRLDLSQGGSTPASTHREEAA
ncbi:hypothetical protein [Saccharopolyspora sp. NPDC049426]|uniref:hypothetical protein n=1 Tax=Saccharopolyspora sp. NPDC049426 TaxID=3155652 RepID=UPI0034182249